MFARIVRAFGNFYFLHIMNRWVAGPGPKDAAGYCASLGGSCMINYLGEHYKRAAMAENAVRQYGRLISELASQGLRCSLTIKPSQFGFDAGDAPEPEKFCARKMAEVLEMASAKGIFVWLDMESSRFTDFTIDFYLENREKYPVGLCLQANLRRTDGDLSRLAALKGPLRIRLVKGIYPESPGISVNDQAELHKRFLKLIRFAFENSPKTFGIAVGSHHREAISLALELQKKQKKEFFEIQVLKGLLPEYYAELRSGGVKVVEYVPYGSDAFAYSVRRARKNPAFAKSLLFRLFFDAYKKLYG